jgi:hypothetical protein
LAHNPGFVLAGRRHEANFMPVFCWLFSGIFPAFVRKGGISSAGQGRCRLKRKGGGGFSLPHGWVAKRLGSKASKPEAGDMTETAEGGSGKARKRVPAKTAAAVIRQAASKAKCTIHLSVEASQRLDIHATMMGLDRSALVEKLINDHLRRWVVSDRGGPEYATDEDAAA